MGRTGVFLDTFHSFQYLAHVLAELPTRMNRDIDDLLPWNWKPG
jgi:hypothetical protein